MDEIIDHIAELHERYTELWHQIEEEVVENPDSGLPPIGTLYNYVKANHLMNFKLWHTEDIARRKDVPSGVIADCKYKIDELNQKRTNFYELIDASITKLLLPRLPKECIDIQNTETLGMSIDRLSILALKIFHMYKQTQRTDTTPEKVKQAIDKLNILKGQKDSLIKAIKYLIHEYLLGRKKIAAYYQFKMYNDPELNPQLYQHKGECNDGGK